MDADRRLPAPPGITPATTLGELADWVDRAPVRPVGALLALETYVDQWPSLEDPEEIAAAARSRRVPYIATAATATCGYAAWGVAELGAAIGGAGGHSAVVTATLVGTALTVPVLRSVFRHRIPDAWRRRWWLATAGAAAWIDVTALHGPSWEMLGVLALAAAALSARWAAEHELPNPSDLPEPRPEPAAAAVAIPPRPQIDCSRAAQLEQSWSRRVGAGRSPVAAGSTLTKRTDLPNGTQWVIELDPEGNVGATELVHRTGPIARALQVNPAHIILERLEGTDDREDLAALTVVTRDLLVEGVPYAGPRYHDGRIPYGMYADGTGEAEWITFDGTGVRGGLVAGGQGMGKSNLMAALAMGYRAAGEWFVLFGDGDEMGNSSHLLKRVAHDSAKGPDEVLAQLEALEAWYRYRGVLMSGLTTGRDGRPVLMVDPQVQEPVDWIRPCRAFPGYIWFLDEFHRLATDPTLQAANFVSRCARLQRILRKLGGALIVGSQSLLAEDYGGDVAFRGMLAQGNLIALRTGNKSEQHVVGDFGIAPSTLPAGGGYGFGGSGERRAMLRVEHSDDMHRWAAGLPELATDDRSEQVYRRHRAEKKVDAVADFQQRRREMDRWAAALTSGAPLPGEAEEPPYPPRPSTAVGGVSVPQPPARRLSAVPDPAATPRPAQVTPLAAMGPLPTKAAEVLAALASRPGPWRSRELVDATGLSGPDVSKVLGVLVARVLAHRPSGAQGVYAAGGETQDAAAG